MTIFCVRAGCNIWMVSYTSKHALRCFSGKPFVHIHVQLYLRHITWKLQVICGRSAYQTTVILLDTFFVWFRVAWEIWLESYGHRQALFVHWYNIVCVTASMYIHCYFVRYYSWQQNLRTLWLHTTPQTTALLLTLATYTVVFFQLIVYANIKITISGTYYHTPLQVRCQVAKKGNINQG